MKRIFTTIGLLMLVVCAAAQSVFLSDMDLSKVSTGWGTIKKNLSIGGNPIRLKGVTYAQGIGTHADSKIIVNLSGNAQTFTCVLGIDDEQSADKTNEGIVNYRILKDGLDVIKEGTIKRTDKEPLKLSVDIKGWKYLVLEANKGANDWGDHVDWAMAQVTYKGDIKPSLISPTEFDNVATKQIYLSDLDLSMITNGWGTVRPNRSIGGNAIILKEKTYNHGLGLHAPTTTIVKLDGAASRFLAIVGIDDEQDINKTDEGIVTYRILKDGKDVVKEGTVKRTDAEAVTIDLDVTGWKYLVLEGDAGANNWGDHIDWADARLLYTGKIAPSIIASLKPEFACATTFYSLPNVRLMNKFRFNRNDVNVSVTNLPAGLTYHTERMLVEGKITTPGTYTYHIKAEVDGLSTEKDITLIVDDKLVSPTPVMSWLSWNVYDYNVDEGKILSTATLMKTSGLRDLGWNYVCIDDNWQLGGTTGNNTTGRDPQTKKPLVNPTTFPHGMKYVTDSIHSLGLKAGIYSDAAERTCGGGFASYGFETIDAQTYADWGFDHLKYDYCHAPGDRATAINRYTAMSEALKATGRQFFFNVCEWGERKPWEWAPAAGGNAWRMSQDIRDTWRHPSPPSLLGCADIIEQMHDLAYYAGPNHYNDMDMMCIGLYGQGSPSSKHGTDGRGMTQTEYQSQFSMWSMFAAPLTLSFDLNKLDKRTMDILGNKEIIAINQDLMGQQALYLGKHNGVNLYVKDLENGDMAVALLNLNNTPLEASFSLEDIFLQMGTAYAVRDLWLHKTVDTITAKYSTTVQPHETKVYRISLAEKPTNITQTTQQELMPQITHSAGNVQIAFGQQDQAMKTVEVYDTQASLREVLRSKENQINLNTKAYAQGVYILKLTYGGRVLSQKIQLP